MGRGGGGNFGIVTEFVFQLHTQRRRVYAGILLFGPDVSEKVFNTFLKWRENWPSTDAAATVAVVPWMEDPGVSAIDYPGNID